MRRLLTFVSVAVHVHEIVGSTIFAPKTPIFSRGSSGMPPYFEGISLSQ